MHTNIEPQSVFQFFAEISAIPRRSKSERAISEYLLEFARERGLWAYRDEFLNVIIRKEPSAGYENVPAVILQSHTDMVAVKKSDIAHDFDNDPIKLVLDGEYLRADGTTLGADNGIGMAYTLAVLDDNSIAHPPIEALFTADEEEGMGGVSNLDPKLFTGRRLINMDSGDEGEFIIGCAGGMTMSIIVPVEFIDTPAGYAPYIMKVGGLKGGHSGADIHLELGNSNKILSRALNALAELKFHIAAISGGAKENVIPREAEAIILVKDCCQASAAKIIDGLAADIKNEFRASDPDVELTLTRLDKIPAKVFSPETSRKLAMLGTLLPNGVQYMCRNEGFEELVETSINIGLVRPVEGHIEYICSIRSSVATRKHEIAQRVRLVAEAIDAQVKTTAEYPSWELDPNSWIQPFFQEQYEKFSGKKARIAAIHAGLECGWFSKVLDAPDMVSFGPNLIAIHSPDEKIEIASVGRMWEFLKRVLANMK